MHMGMRMDYEVRPLPETYGLDVPEYAFETIENGRANRWGEKPQRMVTRETANKGGVLIIVRGKPGHSFRINTLEQAEDFKLIDHDEYLALKSHPKGLMALRPRLFDTNTGEQVNENGIPLNIARELAEGTTMPRGAGRHARGNVETDIDVNTTGDEDIAGNEVPADESVMAGHDIIAAQIDETE